MDYFNAKHVRLVERTRFKLKLPGLSKTLVQEQGNEVGDCQNHEEDKQRTVHKLNQLLSECSSTKATVVVQSEDGEDDEDAMVQDSEYEEELQQLVAFNKKEMRKQHRNLKKSKSVRGKFKSKIKKSSKQEKCVIQQNKTTEKMSPPACDTQNIMRSRRFKNNSSKNFEQLLQKQVPIWERLTVSSKAQQLKAKNYIQEEKTSKEMQIVKPKIIQMQLGSRNDGSAQLYIADKNTSYAVEYYHASDDSNKDNSGDQHFYNRSNSAIVQSDSFKANRNQLLKSQSQRDVPQSKSNGVRNQSFVRYTNFGSNDLLQQLEVNARVSFMEECEEECSESEFSEID